MSIGLQPMSITVYGLRLADANTDRPHQGIDEGSMPEAAVINIADVRTRHLERWPYARGIFRGDPLVAAAPPGAAAVCASSGHDAGVRAT